MGVDAFDLVLEIESRFDVSFQTSEAERIRTVGDLITYVEDRCASQSGPICLTSKSFHRLREALVKSLGLPRNSIYPSRNIADLIPFENRTTVWQNLRSELVGLPNLVCETRIRIASLIAVVTICAGVFAVTNSVSAFVSSSILSSFLVYWITRPFAIHFQPNSSTVKGVVLALCRSIQVKPLDGLDSSTIAEQIREILSKQIGVSADEVNRETRLRDLF